MPFASDKQRKYLWSQKPEVAKKFAEHKDEGGSIWDRVSASPMQIRNRQYNEYLRSGSKKKFQDWLDAGGGQDVDTTQPSIAQSAYDVARVATPIGSIEDAQIAGEEFAKGDYLSGLGHAGLAAAGVVPFVGPLAKGARAASKIKPGQLARGLKMAAEGNPYGKHAIKGALGKGRQKAGPLKPEIAYATNRFDEIPRGLTRKEEMAADLLGPDGRKIVADMKREAADPSLAIGENLGPLQQIRETIPRGHPYEVAQFRAKRAGQYHPGGAGGMQYRPYQTPSGEYVHSTYDPKGNVQNILGGTRRNLADHDVPTVGGARRPSGNFDVVTHAQAEAGHPGKQSKLKDLIKKAPLGSQTGAVGSESLLAPEKQRRLAALRAAGLIK